MGQPIVEFRSVYADYGRGAVLKSISFSFDQGSLVVLGPNGAGKTTMINIVLGLLKPARGECIIFGRKCEENLSRGFTDIAASAEKPNIVRGSILDFIDYISFYRNVNWGEFYDYIDRFNLRQEYLRRKFKDLSTGEKMKLYLSAVLSIESKLYVLDEPNSNLDVDSRKILGDILLEKLRKGAHFIITTHIYEYINDVATHLLVLSRGEILVFGRVEEAMKRFAEGVCLVTVKSSNINKFVEELNRRGLSYRRIESGLFLVYDCQSFMSVKDLRDLAIDIKLSSLEVLYKTIMEGVARETR